MPKTLRPPTEHGQRERRQGPTEEKTRRKPGKGSEKREEQKGQRREGKTCQQHQCKLFLLPPRRRGLRAAFTLECVDKLPRLACNLQKGRIHLEQDVNVSHVPVEILKGR